MEREAVSAEVQNIKIPPHDLEAEKAVLGAVLIDAKLIHDVLGILGINSDVFYDEKNKKIYLAMLELLQNSTPIDLLTLKSNIDQKHELDRIGGMDYLTSLVETVEVSANAEEYAHIVKDKYLLRALIEASSDVINMCLKEKKSTSVILDKSAKRILDVTYDRVTSSDFDRLGELGKSFLTEIGSSRPRGTLKFGFRELDSRTFGLHQGELIIIAARPSVGKTTFGTNICLNVARQLVKDYKGEKPPAVCIFSLEMSSDELLRRVLSAEAHIAMNRLRYETLDQCITSKDESRINSTINKMQGYPVFIDGSSTPTVLEMKAKARRLQTERGIGLILVDYIQLMPGSMGGVKYRQFEIAEISRSLKLMAKDLGVPVIAISQLSREVEKRTGKSAKPRLSDLRDSGAIEQDADLVLFLHRSDETDDGNANPVMEVIIGKQRNGALGTINLKFRKEFSQFAELEKTFGEEEPA
ncbi:MAG: replicative DNA helicase [bacterium]